MLTKTKENKEKDDLNANHSFSIPENIQKDIQDKGFYLYEWIGEQDVKQSIERDFLKIIKKFWTFFSLILIIPSTIFYIIWSLVLFYIYFVWVLVLINSLLIIYLIILAIKRSNILRKNSHILITDTSVSINWKIRKLKNNSIVSNTNLDDIWELFEEDLFKESNIYKTKKWFFKQVTGQIWKGFSKIMSIWSWRSREWWKLILILLALYVVYTISLWIIYLFGIFFIWFFWLFLSFINKQILLKTGHEITTINNSFENIDDASKNLLKYKEEISILLANAVKNDWKDSLLIKITNQIKNINNYASTSIDTSIKLKKQIISSKYKEMFNFWIYNSWIKKQVYQPILEIKNLLEKNLKILNETKADIIKQIDTTEKESFKWTLQLQEKRIDSQILNLSKNVNMLDSYLQKLT